MSRLFRAIALSLERTRALTVSGFPNFAPPAGNWILTTGFWVDTGEWIDSDSWID